MNIALNSMKTAEIRLRRWFAVATTVSEALAAEAAGADAIVAQGAEAGGHRGAFEAQGARDQVGLFAAWRRAREVGRGSGSLM